MKKIKVSIIGASGYAGGELLRLLLNHPNVEIIQVTSQRFQGKFIFKVHPNLRGLSKLKFESFGNLKKVNVLFLCLPHTQSQKNINYFKRISDKIIDLSADFRLKSIQKYKKWYNEEHCEPEMLNEFVYGIPELYKQEMKKTNYVSSAGCNATATILALYPLFKENLVDPNNTVVEVKVGSSESGNTVTQASHHPQRAHVVRSFMPTNHRHTAEIEQELSIHQNVKINFSATSIDLVRGILATSHVFLKSEFQLDKKIDMKFIWRLYRKTYKDSPFIRIVNEKEGNYRFPEPKLLWGTNYCDIGFKIDENSNRIVVISAIDNLMKGAAGQAVQAFNILYNLEETTSLKFSGLHPI